MSKIIIILSLSLQLLAGVLKSPLLTYNEENATATIKIDHISVGMSGFITHRISPEHSSILKNIVVVKYDKNSQIATLKVSDFNALDKKTLPKGKWKVALGDSVVLTFGYSRALLIAPSEELYYRITRGLNIQWLHPDIFATLLSSAGHPTPLKEDFDAMVKATSIGLIFLYLDKRVYTLDAKSFKILDIVDAPLVQESAMLPFYSRVHKIDANWFGEGSERLREYAPYYYKLLLKYNKDSKRLLSIVKGIEKQH